TQALRRRDGTTVLADISMQQLSDGRTLCVALNVTDAHRIETALQLLAESGPVDDTGAFVERCISTLAQAFGGRHAAVGVLDDRATVRILGQSLPRQESSQTSPVAHAPCGRLSAEQRSMHITGPAVHFPRHAPFAGCESGAYLGAAILSSAGT